MTKTVYPAGVPIHFYSKSIDGQGIFYRTEDKLVFLTSLSCIVRKYDLDVIAFCLMFNHFHLLVKVKSCSHALKAIAEFKKRIYSSIQFEVWSQRKTVYHSDRVGSEGHIEKITRLYHIYLQQSGSRIIVQKRIDISLESIGI